MKPGRSLAARILTTLPAESLHPPLAPFPTHRSSPPHTLSQVEVMQPLLTLSLWGLALRSCAITHVWGTELHTNRELALFPFMPISLFLIFPYITHLIFLQPESCPRTKCPKSTVLWSLSSSERPRAPLTSPHLSSSPRMEQIHHLKRTK